MVEEEKANIQKQLLTDVLVKQLNKIHGTTGTIEPFFGLTIFKYVANNLTTVIKVLDPEQRDVNGYIENVHPRIQDFYKKLNNPRNVARINEKLIKFGNMHILQMADYGDSLKKVLQDSKNSLDSNKILDFSLQIALGIAQLQFFGINHRDLKPSNVILVGQTLKIIDFDISRKLHSQITSTMTGTKNQLSQPYASPKRLIEKQSQRQNIEIKRSNTWFRDDAYSLGVVILEFICHGHPSLVKKFKAFFNKQKRVEEKVFKKGINQLLGEIDKVLDTENDYIIKHLVFLVTKLITFDSEKRIDLMAAYKFLKLIEMKNVDFKIGKQFIQQQQKRSSQRITGAICEKHQKLYCYIYFPLRDIQPADNVKAKIATFSDSKQKLIVVDGLKKEKKPIDVSEYNFSTGSRLVSTGDGCYMMGGEEMSNGDTLDINLYCNFSNLSLTKKAKIPDDGRSSSGIAFTNIHNLIVLVGGFRKNSIIAMKIPAYDPKKNAWKASAETLIQRVCPACCFSEQYLYIFGGMTTEGTQSVVNSKKIERMQSKFLYSEGNYVTEDFKVANRNKDFDKLLASCDALCVCLGQEKILILGGSNEYMSEDSKDGYIIDFKKNKFNEIQEPSAFSKTSFYTPGAWVDDNFLVPKPGASGEGELYIGKLDSVKGEISFNEINKSDKKYGY